MANVISTRSPALDDLYRQLKELEGQIPIPQPTGRALVGTLDAKTGQFVWSLPHRREVIVNVPGRSSEVTIVGTLQINAVNVELTFNVRNRQVTDFDVSVDGATVRSPEGIYPITISVGRASNVGFTVRSGNVSFSAALEIKRFAFGAGAFTLDALPIALVYCPLQGQERQNRVMYQRLESVGTTLGFSYSREDSDTAIEADGIAQLAGYAGRLGEALGGTIAGTVLKGFGLLLSGFGSDMTQEGILVQANFQHQVETKTLEGITLSTPAGAAPGEGDETYILLQNVQAAWVASDGDLRIAIIQTPERSLYRHPLFKRTLPIWTLEGHHRMSEAPGHGS